MLNRRLKLKSAGSILLLGPRRTGKSTLLRHEFPDANLIDLLKSDVFFEYRQRPALIRERFGSAKALTVVDEIQLIPELVREVHWLIENAGGRFILCGSSARKLRRQGITNLAGRLRSTFLMALTYAEIPDFDLQRYLQYGGLPSVVLGADPADELRQYCGEYLKEEIQAEGIVRHLDSFIAFLDAAAISNGSLVSYANIARDAGVSPKTIHDYFQILEDTLIGFRLLPFTKSIKRRAIRTPKFFFFDCGIPNTLLRRVLAPKTPEYGHAFEHFMILEARAAQHYDHSIECLEYWRSASGFEVDLIIDGHTAIEFKSGRINDMDGRGLRALAEEHKIKNLWLVCTENQPRRLEKGILVLPWQQYIARISSGEFFSDL